MNIRVLGCSGAELPDFRPPAFLVDGQLLLDAGTISSVLSFEEQSAIHSILVTHAHLDHVRAISSLADNLIAGGTVNTVGVFSIPEVIDALRGHLFNDIIWPDFSQIPCAEKPVLRFNSITREKDFAINDYRIRAIPVSHTVPAVGYLVQKGTTSLIYTGDTGPTEDIWNYAAGVDAMIVEVSFPNRMEQMAHMTRHLTSSLLEKELQKVKILPPKILITHPKPQYFEVIRQEIAALGISNIEMLRDGDEFQVGV